MATTSEVLQRLVQGGALIEDAQNSGLRLLPIFAELISPPPRELAPAAGVLYWVDAGAEDQHHTHFRPYAQAEIIHDRDLRLTDNKGAEVAYIAPIEEWPFMDSEALRQQLSAARRAAQEDVETFTRFVDDCRPRSTPVTHRRKQ